MKSLTSKEQDLIIKNVLKACKDINKLNKRGYNFLYLANGFIAHYNLNGFKGYYSSKVGRVANDLKTDILRYKNFNQYNNFSITDKDYDYYMTKKHVYNVICASL